MKELSEKFLKCAKDDLDTCEILYKNKKYAPSTYFLQQAVEKASKAYVLNIGNFSKKEIKQINHNSPEAFVKLLGKMVRYVDIIHDIYPDMKTDTKGIEQLIENKKKCLELAKTNYKSFQVIFKMYDNIIKAFEIKLEDMPSLISGISLQDTLKEGLKDISEDIVDYVDNKDNKEIIESCDTDSIKKILLNSVDHSMLYTLA
ncbi:MAG: HEPN domain-containing protein [Candidatus Thermoplasmatota archaeon]|nr:HEPN domain-containing protein [Candidatus Thermoplasmatota archaeon]